VHCPYCNSPDSKVTDSRSVADNIRRRRECDRCGLRFTTYERVQSTALLVVKRDGRRQEFDRDKLLSRIVTACAKRPIAFRDIEKTVQNIESELQALGRAEIPSSAIGETVMNQLRQLDRVAYIRWASVYRDFQDLESFERVVRDLQQDNIPATERTQLPMLQDEMFPRPPDRSKSRNRGGLAK